MPATGTKPLIPPEDRIPLRQKLACAVGVNMDIFSNSMLIMALWMPVFNIGLGMKPLVLSGIVVVLRIWDAFTDPFMGNISDNIRTRWGRRRPLILIGTILVVLIYPLFWHLPTGWGDTGKAVALLVIGLAYYTAYTIWAMPYYGLQLELTPNYDERTRLAAWGSVFAKFGYMLMGWVFAFVLFVGVLASGDTSALDNKPAFLKSALEFIQPLLRWLSAPQAGEQPLVVGMRAACWLICIAMLMFGLAPVFFVKERYYGMVTASNKPRTSFVGSLRESFHCKPLWQLIGMTFFLLIGSAFIDGLYQYVNFYYVCEGDLALGGKIIGIKATLKMVIGLASIPVLTTLSERFDKRVIAVAMLSLLVVGHLANYFLLIPGHPYLQLLTAFSEAIAIPAIWMFMPAMKADVADWDEHKTSLRREGALNSFYSWFVKAALTVSFLFNGLALHWCGFDAKLPAQAADVTRRMFVYYLCLPLVFWLISIAFAWFYPLGRKTAADIRAALEARRGKI